MISCVMPTGGRPDLAHGALEDWLNQTYKDSELVILDSLSNPSFPEPLSIPGVFYCRQPEPETLGEKRNQLNALASFPLIAHWDDDDIHAPDDLATRAELMHSHDCDIAGYSSIHFYSAVSDRWWQYVSARMDYAVGTSLIYHRSWWEDHPFRYQKRKSDTAFVMDHHPRVVGIPGGLNIIATIHGSNLNDRPEAKIKSWLNWHEVTCPLADSQTESLYARFRAQLTPTAA